MRSASVSRVRNPDCSRERDGLPESCVDPRAKANLNVAEALECRINKACRALPERVNYYPQLEKLRELCFLPQRIQGAVKMPAA
jgi:hypothetical protein